MDPAAGPVGFIGLGVMGAPMARRLRDAGVPLIVWNRTPGRVEDLRAESPASSVRAAGSPAEVAGAATVIISCLLDDPVIEAVHGGQDGTLAGARPGTVVVEHGTFSPDLAQRLAAAAGRRGSAFLDAPVTGGAAGAKAGTLTTMVGGDPGALDAVRPTLAYYTRLVEHAGPSGSGAALKLINQLLVATHAIAAADAARLIREFGIPADVAERVLTSGWAASAMLARNLGAAIRDRPLDEGAEIHHLALALAVLHGIIDRRGIDAVVEPVVRQRFEYAMRQDLGATDLSGIGAAQDPSRARRAASTRVEQLDAAIEDNADWCDLVCATHGLAASRDRRVWSVPRRPPSGYPDAVTLVPGVDPAEIIGRIAAGPGGSVKDSFADLDLAPHGFRVLFDGSWIYRPWPEDETGQVLARTGWESVEDEATLRRWAAAHDMVGAFRPALLGRPDVRIIGRRHAGEFVAGAVVLAHPRVVGLSNVFCTGEDPATAYPEAVAAAVSFYPGRPVVGYETGDDLRAALAAGFRTVGPLRVWVRS